MASALDPVDSGVRAAAHGAAAADADRDALAFLALRLIRTGSTASELAARFARLGAPVSPDVAAALLERLGQLGLVRIATHDDGQPRFVETSLGQTLTNGPGASRSEFVARLEDLERLRTDLLSTIAHELRTPLTAVRTCIGLLSDPAVRPEPAQYERLIDTVARNADRMQQLVDDVLDLTRFRAGRIRLQLRRLDAREIARDVAAAIGTLVEARGQRLELRLPEDPVWVFGDRRRLEQALTNLASNAQKFAPGGGSIRIHVEGHGAEVAWTVEDDGPGIPEDHQERLFERFFVGLEPGGNRGVGLGLPTALAIAQAHAGGIRVRSAPGEGSTFTLWVLAAGPDEGELG